MGRVYKKKKNSPVCSPLFSISFPWRIVGKGGGNESWSFDAFLNSNKPVSERERLRWVGVESPTSGNLKRCLKLQNRVSALRDSSPLDNPPPRFRLISSQSGVTNRQLKRLNKPYRASYVLPTLPPATTGSLRLMKILLVALLSIQWLNLTYQR